jgi:uncharacterized protein with HEPN domain
MRKQRFYLEDILERIRRIEIVTDSGREAFLASFVNQDAAISNFEESAKSSSAFHLN